MNEIEKRELIEQRRKIFEAGMQRADKRTGTFSFLTWPFFIAPLIAGEEFLAATFKSAAAKEQDAKALQAGAAPRAANDDPPVSDPSKANAENETTKGPAASSDAHAAQLDLNGLPAQSDEDAPKLSAAHSEAVVAASDESGGGGGDVAESRHHDAHTSIDDSSVNSLSADSHLGSGQLPGVSTLESIQSNVLGDSFSPSMIGSTPLLGIVGSLTHDVAGTLAPVEAAVQPVLMTVNDTVGTLSHDVAGTIAPVEAAVQPVLAAVTDTVGSLSHDVSHLADASNVVSDALASAAPVLGTTEPVLASAGASHGSPATDLLHSAVPDISTGQAVGPADTLLALATSTDAPIEVPGSATAAPAHVVMGTSNAAATVHPIPIASDVIALNDAPTPPAHALFAGSQYTHYGVTLSSDIGVPPQHAVSPVDTASAHDTLVPVVADAQKHAPPPPDIVDTTHPIDHLGHAIL